MTAGPNEDEIVQLPTYDSRGYARPGVAPTIRPIVAPYVLQAPPKWRSEQVTDLYGQPPLTGRYR
jgi:fructoselysine 6-phosphate deglycase